VAGVCAAALLLAAAVAKADDAATSPDQQKLLDRIKQLEDKVNDLEGKSTQVVMQASVTGKSLDFLSQVEMSGFVSASYIYDFSRPTGTSLIAGRGFDVNNNQFEINKFKLALEKPVSQDPSNWIAGFRTDLIVGQDAPLTHSSGLFGGPGSSQDIDLEQAFIDLNIPIGTGLKISFGKQVSLMGVEVIEEVSNPNLSVGNQFLYLENFTQTGLQLAYQWTPLIDTEFIVCNGWDSLPDNNNSKSFFGRVGLTFNANQNAGIVGYVGPEEANDNTSWRRGVDVVYNGKFGDKFTLWVQGDYGYENNVPNSSGTFLPRADWGGLGAWGTYDFTDKVELALRADWVKDKYGVRTPVSSAAPGGNVTTAASFSSVPKELYSLTATLNYKPVTNLQIRPELRLDAADSSTAFNGKKDQVTAALGVAYLF
jgi:hypothetical protein